MACVLTGGARLGGSQGGVFVSAATLLQRRLYPEKSRRLRGLGVRAETPVPQGLRAAWQHSGWAGDGLDELLQLSGYSAGWRQSCMEAASSHPSSRGDRGGCTLSCRHDVLALCVYARVA